MKANTKWIAVEKILHSQDTPTETAVSVLDTHLFPVQSGNQLPIFQITEGFGESVF